jgi:hypothetical protein
MNPEFTGLVTGSGNHCPQVPAGIAANYDRFAPVFRVVPYLHSGEKGIHIHVNDGRIHILTPSPDYTKPMFE